MTMTKVCIMREVLELENQQIKFRILSPDTDVLMLVLYFAAKETSSNITFELLNSQNRRQVDVISLVNSIERLKSMALLGVYVYTRSENLTIFQKHVHLQHT